MPDLWGPISANDWRNVPCVSGRAATEDDVLSGAAVFYVQGNSDPFEMSLPCCAVQRLEDGSQQPVVIIQAEIAPYGTIFGVRPLTGGNGICEASEVCLLPDGFGP